MTVHRVTWWVYPEPGNTDPRTRIRRTSHMRGTWGYDATCTCGWDSRTGGATRRYVAGEVEFHKHEAVSQ